MMCELIDFQEQITLDSPFKVLMDLFADRDCEKCEDAEDVCDMAVQQRKVQKTVKSINDRNWLTEKLFRTAKYNHPRNVTGIGVDEENFEWFEEHLCQLKSIHYRGQIRKYRREIYESRGLLVAMDSMNKLVRYFWELRDKFGYVRFDDESNQEVLEKWNKLAEVIGSESTAFLCHNSNF